MTKLAEETFNYTCRLRPKKYLYGITNKQEGDSDSNIYKQKPFCNKKKSTCIPPDDLDTSLDFYIEAVTHEILKSIP